MMYSSSLKEERHDDTFADRYNSIATMESSNGYISHQSLQVANKKAKIY